MDSVTYRIAGHSFTVEGAEEPAMLRRMPGFPVFEMARDGADHSGSTSEWLVCFGRDVQMPEDYQLLNEFVFEETAVQCRFLYGEGHHYFQMSPNDPKRRPLLLRYGGGDRVEATHADDISLLRFALWMALGMLSANHKMVLIHSSVIVHHGKAVLFLGESGTGKSTHTRLWLQNIDDSHLLNDDSPVLAVEEGQPVVYGSPWSGKTHCYHPYRFPLAAVVRLSQAPYNRIRQLQVLDAFSAMHPSCPPALAQDDRFADGIISTISDTIAAVPVFHLECLPDAAAAQTSCNAIFSC